MMCFRSDRAKESNGGMQQEPKADTIEPGEPSANEHERDDEEGEE